MNLLLLEYEMKKRGFDVKMMCSALGMNYVTFYSRRKGITEFTLDEIQNIVTILELDISTARRVFFG